MNETDIIHKINEFYKEGISNNAKWQKRAHRAYEFYKGIQWERGDLQKLEVEGRPALTINQILPIINLISGFQRQNRQQVKVYPRKGGNNNSAEILTALCKHAQDTTNSDFEQSMIFLDGIISGKGWLELGISYQNDPMNGEITIQRLSPFEIIEDTTKEYDLDKTAQYIIRTYWWNKEAIKLSYPKKEKDIALGLAMVEGAEGSPDVITTETNTYQDEGKTETIPELKKYKYKIKECYWKSYERRAFLINTLNLEMKMIHETKEKLVREMMQTKTDTFDPANYTIKDIIVPILHQTISVGNLILENNEDPFNGVMSFPFFRFCPYWVDGYIFGMVENLEDQQKEINKRTSQMLHHLNQSANSGWLGPEGWEVESKEDIEQFGSKAGINIHYRENKHPEKITPAPLSQGHLLLSQIAADNLKTISGANPNLLGQTMTKQESGIAIKERKQQGIITQEIVFDNFNYTLQLFNTALVDIIRQTEVYSDEEIAAIVEDANLEDKINLENIRTFRLGKYGIKISQNPNLPSIRAENFNSILEATKANLPIDPEFVIELSDLPNKDKILADLRAKKQAMQMQSQIQAGAVPRQPIPQGVA